MPDRPRPVVLAILDGWGYREDTTDNAIAVADTANWDRLWRDCPHSLLRTSGKAVGLPEGQMGNSEVGHLNLGAGRVLYQDSMRISRAIEDGSFNDNPALTGAVDAAKAAGGAVHIVGLLSPGGVHSYESHIHAMVRLAVARGAERVFVHAITDGRDTPPKSAEASFKALDAVFADCGRGRLASLIGRYYAMDRDQRWDRIETAYKLMTQAKADYEAPDGVSGLRAAYDRGETDEFVKATRIVPPGGEAITVGDHDAIVFMNFRADRARQLTRTFIEDDFDGFKREVRPRLAAFVSLTQYQRDFDIPVAFEPETPKRILGEIVAQSGLKQLRIAETEKYAHVTFFFNGGEERPFPGEDRTLIPSPRVATYDLQPEMSSVELTDRLVEAISGGHYDLIICNYANADMVGHTGDEAAAIKAVEAVDAALGRITAALDKAGGELLVTADHGNVEIMRDPTTGQPYTAHTTGPVPFVYFGRDATLTDGVLADVAPTLLALLGLDQPAEMTGHSLIKLGAG
ncbi:MAG TPA: 2,3-bisphosphoglycerate-independent phosphoglycerate mutase [Gammaproteobacteria bacterium]|nr:2,3-bisphosphoglycerate-independent phosphoglycerate mutase [Gammaproteobacteria bacterium]